MLHIKDLTYFINGRPLLNKASASISSGYRVGLIGANGSGKSTLLRLITQDAYMDGGSISLQQGTSIGYLEQETSQLDITPLEHVLRADKEREMLLQEAQTATDPLRISEIHNRLSDINAHAASARAHQILNGLGFTTQDVHQPLHSFSGGWRMRVFLAATLFQKPDILLLDEPTNHLDLEATVWLQDHLAKYPYTTVIVSHDRNLLNTSVSHILNLEHQRLSLFKGNYNTFEKTRRTALMHQTKIHAQQQVKRKKLESFINRFRAQASKSKQAQSRIKILEKMDPIPTMVNEALPDFYFPSPEVMPSPLIVLENGRIGYDQTTILQNVNVYLNSDDRIALLGRNGNGKSTLAKWLAHVIKTQSGYERRSKKLQIGYFAQSQLEQLIPTHTVLQHMQNLMLNKTEAETRSHLAHFGFFDQHMKTVITNLSGGEKARLVFATIVLKKPNVLVLDEPTNHLDIQSRQILIQALIAFEGAVIIISHDAHIIEHIADKLLIIENKTVKNFDGTMDDYYKKILAKEPAQAKATSQRAPLQEKKQKTAQNGSSRTSLLALKKQARDQETLITELETKIAIFNKELSKPTLYVEQPKKAGEYSKAKTSLERQIKEAENQWLELEETIRNMSNT